MNNNDDSPRIYSVLNDSLLSLQQFLAEDGKVLVQFLIEQEVLDHAQARAWLDSVDYTLIWLYNRLNEFDQQYATADAALALTEVFADLINYVTNGLNAATMSAGVTAGSHPHLSAFAKIPVIDLASVHAIIEYLPYPTEVEQIKNTLASITGTASLPHWTDNPVTGVIPVLRTELLLIPSSIDLQTN